MTMLFLLTPADCDRGHVPQSPDRNAPITLLHQHETPFRSANSLTPLTAVSYGLLTEAI